MRATERDAARHHGANRAHYIERKTHAAGERSAPFVVALIGQRELTGFSLGKIDLILDEAAEKKAEVSAPEDDVRRTACEARPCHGRAICGSLGRIAF